MSDIILTIFTPAYNRAHTIGRTYESLLNQENKNFIWLVVDDGSTDNIKELVDSWQQNDNGFEIRYVYKENGGMHTAHNTAFENIDTELCTCIDSDDKLSLGAVDKILNKWEEVKGRNLAGLIGLDADFDGKIIGSAFKEGVTETTLKEFYAGGGTGDKKLVFRTDVIKNYPPYPVFEGERYVALGYKYRLIDNDYKYAVINEPLCDVEYQANGSTNTMWKQYRKNPKGFAFWRLICMQNPAGKGRYLVDNIHYISSSILAKNKGYIKKSPRPFLSVLLWPMGFILSLITRIKGKSK